MQSHTPRAEVELGLEPMDNSPYTYFPQPLPKELLHPAPDQETDGPEAVSFGVGVANVRALPLTGNVTGASYLIYLGLRSPPCNLRIIIIPISHRAVRIMFP